MPAWRLLFSLLVYQPLVYYLRLFPSSAAGAKETASSFPSVWMLVSLLLHLTPSRQVADLATLIPLCALASFELVRSVDIFPDERIEIIRSSC